MAEQKRQVVAEITQTLRRVLGKRSEHTHVIIEEVDPENWGFAGMLTSEYHGRDSWTTREEDHDEGCGPGPLGAS